MPTGKLYKRLLRDAVRGQRRALRRQALMRAAHVMTPRHNSPGMKRRREPELVLLLGGASPGHRPRRCRALRRERRPRRGRARVRSGVSSPAKSATSIDNRFAALLSGVGLAEPFSHGSTFATPCGVHGRHRAAGRREPSEGDRHHTFGLTEVVDWPRGCFHVQLGTVAIMPPTRSVLSLHVEAAAEHRDPLGTKRVLVPKSNDIHGNPRLSDVGCVRSASGRFRLIEPQAPLHGSECRPASQSGGRRFEPD